jgi:hypothetical protein
MKLLFILITFFVYSGFAQDLSEGERSQIKLNEKMWAAIRANDNIALVKSIDEGAKPNRHDVGDQVPVYWAISKKNWKSALILIEKGASPCVGTINITPLLSAAEVDPKLWDGISDKTKEQLMDMGNLSGYRKVCRSSTEGSAPKLPSSSNTLN